MQTPYRDHYGQQQKTQLPHPHPHPRAHDHQPVDLTDNLADSTISTTYIIQK